MSYSDTNIVLIDTTIGKVNGMEMKSKCIINFSIYSQSYLKTRNKENNNYVKG